MLTATCKKTRFPTGFWGECFTQPLPQRGAWMPNGRLVAPAHLGHNASPPPHLRPPSHSWSMRCQLWVGLLCTIFHWQQIFCRVYWCNCHQIRLFVWSSIDQVLLELVCHPTGFISTGWMRTHAVQSPSATLVPNHRHLAHSDDKESQSPSPLGTGWAAACRD